MTETRRYSDFLNNFDNQIKSNIRNIEKLNNKEITAKYGVLFNKTCLSEGLLPKYTNIRTHDPVARQERFTLKYRRELIVYQLKKHEDDLNEIKIKLSQAHQELSSRVDKPTKISIQEKLDELKHNKESGATSLITAKLNNLYRGNVKFPKPNEAYINLSSYQLSEDQKTLLNLGTK